jgi:hypothetical protein
MGAGHFAAMTSAAVVGGEAGLGFAYGSRQETNGSGQRGSIHDALLSNQIMSHKLPMEIKFPKAGGLTAPGRDGARFSEPASAQSIA